MFKKGFTLIFLALVFFSFNNQTNAMQESESTAETEIQDVLHCKQEICCMLSEILKDSKQVCPSLQFLAASAYLKILKAVGQEIDTLGVDIISKDLKAYCKFCYIIPSINFIHKHLASIEQLKIYKYLKITDENLDYYNTVLHQLIYNIDNHICDRNFPETFFIFLARFSCTYLFKDIIDKEKSKNYDWHKIFSIENAQGQLLHNAAVNSADNQGIFKIILELMKDKNLRLVDFINIQNITGLTPLMCATINGNYKIVKLLIKHGADIYILNLEGKTALEIVIENKEYIQNKPKKLERANRCIELLTSKQQTSNNCALQ